MLVIQNLNKTYPGPVAALADVDLELSRGVFGLLGPNGAGKTTLMRTLATLQLPDKGTARLGNLDLIHNPAEARRRIGYLPQEMGVYPRVTAREMLEYIAGLKGIGPRRERQGRASEQLRRVNLEDVADRRLDTYSGGMRQRFGIAAAFLGDPELVIVDEPTAGLDPAERRRFQWMLSEAAQNCVLILSSHIVEDIAGLCENMAIMNRGRVVLSGDPRELVRGLEGKIWELNTGLDELDRWQQGHKVLSWRPVRGQLLVRLWAEEPPAAPMDGETVGLTRATPDLEDLYAMQIGSGR